MNNTWFLSLRYSWFSGRDKVGHRSLQCYDLKIENRELTAGSLPSHDALSGQPGRRPPGLDYCLFPCLMKGSHLWWNSLCEVYSHRTTKEKSLSCSLAASSAKPYARHSVGSHKPQDSCSFRPTVNVLGIKGTSEQGQVDIIFLSSKNQQILLLRDAGINIARRGIGCWLWRFFHLCLQTETAMDIIPNLICCTLF